MTNKTIVPVSKLCERVASECMEDVPPPHKKGSAYCYRGRCYSGFWLEEFLLSSQGRELMENHVKRHGVETITISLDKYVAFYGWQYVGAKSLASSDTGDIGKDYLLCTAQLTKCFDPDKEEVEW